MRSIWITILAAGTLIAAEKTVTDLQGMHARQRVIVGTMSDEAFDKMAFGLLGPTEITVGELVAYGSVQDRVAAGPRGFDHCSYGQWRAVIDTFAKSHSGCPAVKEAVKIGANVVVRTVGTDCRRTQRVLRGDANPLLLRIGGNDVEVLEIQLGPLTSAPNENQIAVHVYARTNSRVTASLARAVTEQMLRLTGTDFLGVQLRADAWFVTDCGFPPIYAFEDRGGIPSYDQLAQMPAAGCAVGLIKNGNIRCSVAPEAK